MMARMEMDYKMDFLKLFRVNFFQIFKFGLEIFEILQKKLLQYEIPSGNCFLPFS